jgi:sulfur carrier protein ThiS
MKLRVKLFGTLSQQFPGYQHQHGIEVEIPDGAKVKDLLALLKIGNHKGVSVIMEGRIVKADDTVQRGISVSVLQAISGG